MVRGPNVKTNFLENFVESWIFMYMMDSNQITPEMVYKFIDGLYKDTYPGLILDYKVEIVNYDDKEIKRLHPDVNLHVLMDDEVYRNTGEGYLAVQDMEDKLKGILKYLPYPSNVNIIRYISESHENFSKKKWEDRTKNL
jgi:hypothetical protein